MLGTHCLSRNHPLIRIPLRVQFSVKRETWPIRYLNLWHFTDEIAVNELLSNFSENCTVNRAISLKNSEISTEVNRYTEKNGYVSNWVILITFRDSLTFYILNILVIKNSDSTISTNWFRKESFSGIYI